MADLDRLQLDIVAQDKSSETINKISQSIEDLGKSLERLNAGKLNTVTKALERLTTFGATTNMTTKAIKGLSNELASTFGVRTKKGISEIQEALYNVYDAEKYSRKGDTDTAVDKLLASENGLREVIKTHFTYQQELDESISKTRDFINVSKKEGRKIGVGSIKGEFDKGEIAELKKYFGSVLDFSKSSTGEGFGDLEEFLKQIKEASGADINLDDVTQGLRDVKNILEEASQATLKFDDALSLGEPTAQHLGQSITDVQHRISDLVTEQEKLNATDGFGGIISFLNILSNTQIPDLTTFAQAANSVNSKPAKQIAQAVQQAGNAAQATTKNTQNLSQATQNVATQANAANKSINAMNGSPFNNVAQGATQAANAINNVTQRATQAAKAVNNVSNQSKGGGKKVLKGAPTEGVLTNISELSEALEKVSGRFDKLAEKHIKTFKLLITPFKEVAGEQIEKFKEFGESFSKLQVKFQAKLKKMSDFWKRTMKTFTFMLVRKAITAIIKEVGNAVQSLAMYSNAMGTAFNTDISNMVADFQYLGRSIVSVFAPLLNTIIPIIDAIVDRIATLISYIGMLFAALGGGTSFTRAKKNVDNYAESLDSASKSSKNLTMGIDELNILSEKSGGSAKPYDGWEDAWEEVDIPAWIQDVTKAIQDFWKSFFDPLKEAWDRAEQYLIDGFKTMFASLKKMFGSIIDDFLTMWNEEATIRMFTQMLKVAGDLMRVVRNLADNFDNAWKSGKTGLKILQNLRDIAAILVDHVRNVSYYMIDWSKGVKFDKILEAFEELTSSAEEVADFIGGVFEDIAKRILDHFEWSIEEGTPHLMETISGIFRTFDFATLREALNDIWDAFEELFINIHTGITNAIGNLGKMVARFTRSKTFTDFLQRVVDISKLITKERVEKVLTGIGKGILNLIEALMKFVNSDAFIKFLQAIAKWIDTHSVDQIAGVLEKIAIAIGLFKFTAFASEKLAGFFQFATTLLALKNLGEIATNFTKLAGGISKTGEAAVASSTEVATLGEKFLGLHSSISPLVGIIGSVFVAYSEFKGVKNSVNELIKLIDGTGEGSLGGSILGLVAKLGIAAAAFTALLGFPAGLIATGCVAAVAAVKGIQETVEELDFSHVTDAITTQGETTIARVKEWYGESTSIVSEHVQAWKDIERDLTQGRGDIDAYAKSIEGLSAAFSSHVQATVAMGDTLVSTYSSMRDSINNYIDESTNLMVQNLLSQRNYLEAQGKDVDEMIANLLVGADEQKGIVNDALTAMEEAQKKYSEAVETYGKESDEAKEAYKALKDAIADSSPAFEQWQTNVDSLDTSEAVEEITKLGKSLDLSQYDYENGWADAANDISGAISEIRTKTETGLQEINETYEGKIRELNEFRDRNPLMPDEYYKIELDAITSQWADDTQTLVNAAEESLGVIDSSLVAKLQEVSSNAEKEWEEAGALKRIARQMGTKDDYVFQQMQIYVNEHLGESGLTGLMNEAYEAIPGNVQQSAMQAMTDLVNNGAEEYSRALGNIDVNEMIQETYTPYQEIVDGIPDKVDYDTSSKAYAERQMNAAKLAMEGAHYDEVSQTFVDGAGNALINNSTDLENYNRIMAGYGVNAFSDEYKTQLTEQSELFEAIKAFGTTTVSTYNDTVTEELETSETPITTWVDKIVGWFHDGALKFGSPSQTMIDFGKDTVDGYNIGIEDNIETTQSAIANWFASIKDNISEEMDALKEYFNEKLSTLFNSDGVDFTQAFVSVFQRVKETIVSQMQKLGAYMTGTALPSFRDNYITPFFSESLWQPLFDMLHANTFIVNFERFVAWFTDEAMTPFWEDSVLPWIEPDLWDEYIFTPLSEMFIEHFKNFVEWWDITIEEWWMLHLIEPWFTKDKWDEDIFTPLKENIDEHWKTFIEWWDFSMDNWWKEHVEPYFTKELWKEQFTHVLDIAEEVFDKIREAIHERISSAAEAVNDACHSMMDSLNSVLSLIGEVMAAISGFGSLGGAVTFNYSGQFATGGFPTQGSLFVAGEAGAEFVGNVGGQTGVVSNDEITGIADAVYSTGNQEAVLLETLINLTRNMLDKDPVVIGDRDIARMANNGQHQLGMTIIS